MFAGPIGATYDTFRPHGLTADTVLNVPRGLTPAGAYLTLAFYPGLTTWYQSLVYFSTARTTSRRHAKWASTLAAYTYNIIYRRGAANGQTDALSRRADHGPPPLPSLPIIP